MNVLGIIRWGGVGGNLGTRIFLLSEPNMKMTLKNKILETFSDKCVNFLNCCFPVMALQDQ
jgi:hypothetical protein